MSDNSGSWFWTLVGLFVILMITQPNLRTKVFSALSDGHKTDETSGNSASPQTIEPIESSGSRFTNAFDAAQKAYRDRQEMDVQLSLYREALRYSPPNDSTAHQYIGWRIKAIELEQRLVGRWVSIGHDGTKSGSDTWNFSPDYKSLHVINVAGSSVPLKGKFKVLADGSKPSLFIDLNGSGNYQYHADLYFGGNSMTMKDIVKALDRDYVREQ